MPSLTAWVDSRKKRTHIESLRYFYSHLSSLPLFRYKKRKLKKGKGMVCCTKGKKEKKKEGRFRPFLSSESWIINIPDTDKKGFILPSQQSNFHFICAQLYMNYARQHLDKKYLNALYKENFHLPWILKNCIAINHCNQYEHIPKSQNCSKNIILLVTREKLSSWTFILNCLVSILEPLIWSLFDFPESSSSSLVL